MTTPNTVLSRSAQKYDERQEHIEYLMQRLETSEDSTRRLRREFEQRTPERTQFTSHTPEREQRDSRSAVYVSPTEHTQSTQKPSVIRTPSSLTTWLQTSNNTTAPTQALTTEAHTTSHSVSHLHRNTTEQTPILHSSTQLNSYTSAAVVQTANTSSRRLITPTAPPIAPVYKTSVQQSTSAPCKSNTKDNPLHTYSISSTSESESINSITTAYDRNSFNNLEQRLFLTYGLLKIYNSKHSSKLLALKNQLIVHISNHQQHENFLVLHAYTVIHHIQLELNSIRHSLPWQLFQQYIQSYVYKQYSLTETDLHHALFGTSTSLVNRLMCIHFMILCIYEKISNDTLTTENKQLLDTYNNILYFIHANKISLNGSAANSTNANLSGQSLIPHPKNFEMTDPSVNRVYTENITVKQTNQADDEIYRMRSVSQQVYSTVQPDFISPPESTVRQNTGKISRKAQYKS